MKTLQNLHQQQQESNQQLGLQIEALAQQIKDLQQQFRVQETIAKNQQTFNQQFEKQVKGLASLLKDACSLYPVEMLDGIKDELNDIVDEVKKDYDELSQSDRFLNAPEEDNVIPLEPSEVLQIEPELPPEDDDTQNLTPNQVEMVMEELSEDVVNNLRVWSGLNGNTKTLSKIATKLASISITHKQLRALIESFSLQRMLTA